MPVGARRLFQVAADAGAGETSNGLEGINGTERHGDIAMQQQVFRCQGSLAIVCDIAIVRDMAQHRRCAELQKGEKEEEEEAEEEEEGGRERRTSMSNVACGASYAFPPAQTDARPPTSPPCHKSTRARAHCPPPPHTHTHTRKHTHAHAITILPAASRG